MPSAANSTLLSIATTQPAPDVGKRLERAFFASLIKGVAIPIIVAEEKIMTIAEEIRKNFAERIHKDHIDDASTLKDLGLDSLDVVELCLDLEDRYHIEFETDELSSFKTVGDLFAAIEKKTNAK